MTNAGLGTGGGDSFSVDWTGDLGVSELPPGWSGSNADHGEINLAGTAISTGANLSFDFSLTAWDERTQFSLIDNDYLFLGARATFPTTASTVEVEWRATADTIDFSGWNSYAKQNLHEAVTVGSLPVSTGSGWNPILVQSSSATATVPEPSHCVAICMVTTTWWVRRRRADRTSSKQDVVA